MNLTPFTASAADIEKAGQAVFKFRQRAAKDTDGRYRQPMMYAEHTWTALPPTVKVYYCDMAVIALTAVGIACPNTPVFTEPVGSVDSTVGGHPPPEAA